MKTFRILILSLTIAGCTTSPVESGRRDPAAVQGIETKIVVSYSASSIQIPPTLLGLSYEKEVLSSLLLSANDVTLIHLLKSLGPGVLRVGANAVDKTNWDSSGPGRIATRISPPDLDRLALFVQAVGWKVIYGINLGSNTPALAADEAAYAAKVLGDRLMGFEIGNEPDLYSRNGIRPANYNYSDFKTEWESYQSAIRARLPDAIFTGPAVALQTSTYLSPFAQDEKGRIALLTQHYYRADGKAATSTLDVLLSPDPNLQNILMEGNSAAAGADIKFRLDECNSFYHGGAPGISDGFGTALWAIDFLFQNIKAGSVGVNFHGGGDGPGYTPIADDGRQVTGVRPVFYAMFILGKIANNTLMDAWVQNGTDGFSVFPSSSHDGSIWIVLNNKDRANQSSASITLPKDLKSAKSWVLTAPTLESTSGYAFGGAVIQNDGNWNPASTGNSPVLNRQIHVMVPPASAVLVHVQ